MNKNLPIEIVNKILIMRPTHPIAKLFEEDENVKIWKKYYRIRWFFMHFILIVIILLIVIVDYMMKYFLLKVEKGIIFLEMIILEKICNISKKIL